MRVFGITGGIGMGKSTSGKLLQSRGVPVVDTDELARQLVEPGQPALPEILKIFGPGLLSEDGRLRRDELARRIFPDSTARKQLEEILHPRIRELWRCQVAAWARENRSVSVVIIPLLFETNAQTELDATICVACTSETQRRRLLQRDWPADQIAQRIQAQLPVDKKMALANFVVWTEAGLDVHEQQLHRIIPGLT